MSMGDSSYSSGTAWRATWVTLACLVALNAAYWLSYAYAQEFNQRWLRGEDRLIEWITFTGFFGAALVTWSAARKAGRLAFVYLLGLGFFFFVCAGEEISWGQRIFGFATPDSVKAINEQEEFNLHNLQQEWISPLGIVSMIMIAFGVVVPLVTRNRLPGFFPVVAVVPVFFAAELLTTVRKLLKPSLVARFGEETAMVVRLDTAEFKEMVWGVACLLAALSLRRAWNRLPTLPSDPSR